MRATASPPQRSALLLWTAGLLAAWGTQTLWTIGQRPGQGLSCFASAVLALLTVKLFWDGIAAHDQRCLLKRVHRRSKEDSDVHGTSDWASHDVIKKAGMLEPGGIFLGEHDGEELWYKGPNTATVLSPPGGGKSTCFAAQFLFRTDHDLVIVNDPKMELLLVCGEDLKRRGYRVLVISPWYASLAEQFGGDIPTHDDGFDPCSFLNPSDPCVIDDCRLLATLLIPKPAKSSATSEFFDALSRSMLVAFLLLILTEKGSVTLPELRARVMAPEEQVEADIAAMLASSAFSGVLVEEGARLYSPKMNSEREWSGVVSGALRALTPYDAHGPLGRSVRKAGVDFRTVGQEKTVVFFVQPPEKIESHEGYASMVLVLAMEQQARIRSKKNVVILLDELQNLPSALTPILRGIALYRGSGIQFLCIFQFLAALKRHIGESWREFLSVDVLMAFGAPTDPETLDVLSRLSGQTTVRGTTFNSDAERLAGGGLGVGMGVQEVARPLLTPSEVRTMDKGSAIVFTSNLPPILATKQSYLDNKALRRRAGRNPYYG